MKYDDIKAERHDLLMQIAAAHRRLKELDHPILDQLAKTEEAQTWVEPMGWARRELKKMHQKHDPK